MNRVPYLRLWKRLLKRVFFGEPAGKVSDLDDIVSSDLFNSDWYIARNKLPRMSTDEAARHYIEKGARQALACSPAFDTAHYLERYPDVRNAGINPLLHYLRHGKSEGRLRVDTLTSLTLSEAGLRSKDVLVLFGVWDHRELENGIKQVLSALHDSGCSVGILCNNCRMNEEIVDVIPIEHGIFLRAHHAPESGSDVLTEHQVRAIIDNQRIRQPDLSDTEAAEYYESHAKQIRALAEKVWQIVGGGPRYVVLWGSTTPLSRLFISVCQNMGREYLVLERGHFPNTLSVESGEQWGRGQVFQAFARSVPVNARAEAFVALRNWCIGADGQDGTEPGGELQSGDGRRTILVIGSNDQGAGISTRGEYRRFSHSPNFNSSMEMLEYVLSIAQQVGNPRIAYRSHPSLRCLSVPDSVLRYEDRDLCDAIAEVDVCVCLTTTVTALCILYGKPVVQLARSELYGTDTVYEARTREAVAPAIRAAMRKERFDRKLANGYAFLKFLQEDALVGFDGAPIRKTPRDLAVYIGDRVAFYRQFSAAGNVDSYDCVVGIESFDTAAEYRMTGSLHMVVLGIPNGGEQEVEEDAAMNPLISTVSCLQFRGVDLPEESSAQSCINDLAFSAPDDADTWIVLTNWHHIERIRRDWSRISVSDVPVGADVLTCGLESFLEKREWQARSRITCGLSDSIIWLSARSLKRLGYLDENVGLEHALAKFPARVFACNTRLGERRRLKGAAG